MSSPDRWPRTGGMRSGVSFGRPTLVPVMGVPAGSALLFKTPTANLAINGGSQHPSKRKAGGHGPTLSDEVEHLLPTPRATDGPKGGPGQVNGRGIPDSLPAISKLLPTPTACVANDGEGTETWLARRERVKLTAGNGNGMGMPLTIAVQLLPTPTVGDSRNAANRTAGRTDPGSKHHDGMTLVDWARIGVATHRPSEGGNTSSDVLPPPRPTLEDG